MRLISSRVTGLGPFQNFSLDLSPFTAGEIVQVAGPNGAGKTTLLELSLMGAAYRDCPTRGTLRDLATSREASLETTLSHDGREYTIRHLVDSITGKSEALVLHNGAPVLDTTKVRDFDEWSANTFIARDVLLASAFGSQASGGFLAAKPTERKSILLRALGLEAWETRAQAAAARAKSAEADLAIARASLAPLGDADPHAERTMLDAQALLDRARAEEAQARAAVEAKERELSRAHETEKRRLLMGDERTRIDSDIALVAAQLQHSEDRIAGAQSLLGLAPRIRAAAEETARILVEVDEVTAAGKRKLDEAREAERELRAIPPTSAGRVEGALLAANEKRERLTRELAESEALLETTITEHMAAYERHLELDARYESIRDRYEGLTPTRLGILRTGLVRISEGEPDASGVADAAIDAEAREVTEVTEDAVAAARTSVRDAYAKAQELTARKQELDFKACKLTEQLADADVLVAGLSRELGQAKAADAETWQRTSELTQTAERLNAELVPLRARRDALKARLDELSGDAARERELDVAEKQVEAWREQEAQERQRLKDCRNRLARLDSETLEIVDVVRLQSELRELRHTLAALSNDVEIAVSTLAAAKHNWDHQQATAQRRADLDGVVAANQLELSDWTRLRDDLGRNGIQAAEIDGSIDELNVLVNDLLHECHSSRWTMRVDTQRLSGDGKRLLETLDVFILDTESGREGKAETFSGGERAILGEALALALTMVACRRAGLERPTLVRDESGAALDPANARAYVAMLRRASQFTGASHVLVVSHQPDIAELCDARIEVVSG